mmetsp:Transcript_7799/g.11896  ORF Transcript_7799/g.11896 Transcript_7799/m.11896 type:complete len:209 (-) Transcript_7799:280-906(-)
MVFCFISYWFVKSFSSFCISAFLISKAIASLALRCSTSFLRCSASFRFCSFFCRMMARAISLASSFSAFSTSALTLDVFSTPLVIFLSSLLIAINIDCFDGNKPLSILGLDTISLSCFKAFSARETASGFPSEAQVNGEGFSIGAAPPLSPTGSTAVDVEGCFLENSFVLPDPTTVVVVDDAVVDVALDVAPPGAAFPFVALMAGVIL